MMIAKTIVVLLLFCTTCFAGWNETEVNVNTNYASTDAHHMSGGQRLVRIGDTRIIVAAEANATEHLYRSTDGINWASIGTYSSFSGSLIAGPENYVYYFYYSNDRIYMVKFLYDGNPGNGVEILHDSTISDSYNALVMYYSVGATIDRDGRLYVFYPDYQSLFVTRSNDGGTNWETPVELTSGLSAHNYYYPQANVDENNVVCVVFSHRDDSVRSIYFSTSINGANWSRTLVSNTYLRQNTVLALTGNSNVYLFAQQADSRGSGLIANYSSNLGANWNGWVLLDETCGYADPGVAVLEDKTMVIAYRDDDPAVPGGSCGDQSRETVATYNGTTFAIVKNYLSSEGYERVATRSNVRGQSQLWHNYGGTLEWSWVQYDSSGSEKNTVYDFNRDLNILQHTVNIDVDPSSQPARPRNLRIISGS